MQRSWIKLGKARTWLCCTAAMSFTLWKKVRLRGYATENGEVTDGLASVAVSVPDHLGWPVAAVAVTFLAEKVPAEQWPDLAERVKKVAGELSGRIYGRRDG